VYTRGTIPRNIIGPYPVAVVDDSNMALIHQRISPKIVVKPHSTAHHQKGKNRFSKIPRLMRTEVKRMSVKEAVIASPAITTANRLAEMVVIIIANSFMCSNVRMNP
jgi:hypothetical protein